jgi:hypothetical protein
MASTATPYGARPVGTLSSSGSFTAKRRNYPIATTYNTNIFTGDFVEILADGTIALEADVTFSAATLGIFMGCSYTDPTSGQFVNSAYWPANNAATDAVAHVVDDPNVLFQIQGDASIAAVDRGAGFDLVYTAGSTSIGRSRNAVDVATIAAGTGAVNVVEFVEDGDNTAGDAFTDVICRFGEFHFNRGGTGI